MFITRNWRRDILGHKTLHAPRGAPCGGAAAAEPGDTHEEPRVERNLGLTTSLVASTPNGLCRPIFCTTVWFSESPRR
jgi:hypothetical protein